jgi:hypothetical protein
MLLTDLITERFLSELEISWSGASPAGAVLSGA